MTELLSLEKLFEIAPTAVVALSIAAVGWYAGRKSAAEHIATLKEWIESLRQ